jgi:RNA polymerase sigma factor (sigma-70 family)
MAEEKAVSTNDRDYRLEVKIRNNRILKLIEGAGFRTVGEFCRANGLPASIYSTLLRVVAMKESPIGRPKNGSLTAWKKCVVAAASVLGVLPEEMFNQTQLEAELPDNSALIEMSEEQLRAFGGTRMIQSATQEDQLLLSERSSAISDVLAELKPNERTVIEMRFGISDGTEYTRKQIGMMFNLSPERIRQIESNALRKLRHPTRSHKLVGYLGLEE